MIYVVIGILVIAVLFSNKHERDMNVAMEKEEPAQVVGSGFKMVVWTITAVFFAFVVFTMLTAIVGLPK